MIKKGTLVKVNPGFCLARWSGFAIKHPWYALRWAYGAQPKPERIYRVIGIHGKRSRPVVVIRDTTCKTEKYNPIFFMEIEGVKPEKRGGETLC